MMLSPHWTLVAGIIQLFFSNFFIAGHAHAASAQHLGCDISQKGFHLTLKCSLSPTSGGQWDQCYIDVDLDRVVYANPYELADRLPEVKFNISRRAVRETSWFSRVFMSAESVEETSSQQEVALSPANIDIEAPEWRAETSRWKFFLNSQSTSRWSSHDSSLELEIPLHLRYSLPSPVGTKGSRRFGLPKDVVGPDSDKLDSVEVTTGCSSDLLFVMPLTVLFLVIGIAALLLN